MTAAVVVGAGLTGLTVARALARAGRGVTVLERDAEPGGLARTFRHGAFSFDVGPHRFHTENDEVTAFLAAALGDDALRIPRNSGVRAFGRVHDWPVGPRVLASIPPGIALRMMRDLLLRPRKVRGASFEEDVVVRYGRTLYEVFFRPYTERFLGIPAERVHRDWSRAGVDRAVIDPRVRAGSLAELARSALLPPRLDTTFLYPRRGIGELAERLARDLVEAGGSLRVSAPVTELVTSGGRVTAVRAGAEEVAADVVVWTAPLTLALRLLGEPPPALGFLSTVLFNLELRAPDRLGRQWVYCGGDEAFVRVSAPTRFSPEMAPAGRGALCVECTGREGDALWAEPERRLPEVLRDLVRIGAIEREGDVTVCHVERVPDTYPVYDLGYREALQGAFETVRRWPNLVLGGRCGRFWYNNADHSIAQGLSLARRLLSDGGGDPDPWGDREWWTR
ncbi:MAG TPA: FAD-dependent oxidoreductase [Anaeromyxobacter sp.]